VVRENEKTRRTENNKRENTSASTTGGGSTSTPAGTARPPVLVNLNRSRRSGKFGHKGKRLVPVDGSVHSDKSFLHRNAGKMMGQI
jgi:hypothetical protein